MPRKRRGAVEDPKAPAGPAKSHRKEKPPASRNVGLPQPSQPPPTVQAPPAPQDSHIPQDPPLAQSQAQVLQAQQSMHNPPPSHTPDLWQNPQPVQDLLQNQELSQQPTEGYLVYMQSIHNVGLHVSDSIKQNILQGKYIELQTLLPPTGVYGGNVGHKKLVLNNMGEIVAKDTTKKIDSIEKWTDAMHIFASIHLAFHPHKAAELIKYIHTVRLGAARGAVSWYDYDVQYRLRKAMNPSTSWGEVDTELWLLYMSPRVSKPPTITSGAKCFDYNNKGLCSKTQCQYLHLCTRCGGVHPQINCNQSSKQFAHNGQRQNAFGSNPSNLPSTTNQEF